MSGLCMSYHEYWWAEEVFITGITGEVLVGTNHEHVYVW